MSAIIILSVTVACSAACSHVRPGVAGFIGQWFVLVLVRLGLGDLHQAVTGDMGPWRDDEPDPELGQGAALVKTAAVGARCEVIGDLGCADDGHQLSLSSVARSA
jgi:hypothetical protein